VSLTSSSQLTKLITDCIILSRDQDTIYVLFSKVLPFKIRRYCSDVRNINCQMPSKEAFLYCFNNRLSGFPSTLGEEEEEEEEGITNQPIGALSPTASGVNSQRSTTLSRMTTRYNHAL